MTAVNHQAFGVSFSVNVKKLLVIVVARFRNVVRTRTLSTYIIVGDRYRVLADSYENNFRGEGH